MVLWEALDALSHQLELCAVTADTRLVVLIDPALTDDQTAAIRAAVTRTAAQAIEVRIAPDRCAANEPLNAAIDASDLVITTGLHAAPRAANKVPTLHLHGVPAQLFAPHASLRRRVRAVTQFLRGGDMLVLSDANGTNIELSLNGAKVRFDHGFVNERHHQASFPAGWVKMVPAAGTANGQLVLMPGDANQSATRLINSPIVLQIVDDHIAAIEGDSADADVVRALLEFAGEPSAYGIAGLSIGMNPGSAAPGPFDDRLLDPVISQLLAGVVQVSFGENLVADRPCRQTIIMALQARTVHVDELPVLRTGQLEGEFAPDVYEL